MTRNEKKYAARYLEAWNRFGNNLPNEEYDKLSQLRQKLGIGLERAQEINREIVAEAKGGSTVPIRKTGLPNPSGRRGSLTDSVKSPLSGGFREAGVASPYTQILDEVAQYEATIDEILNEVSDVSKKMESIKKQLISISGSLVKESIRLMRRRRGHGKSKTGLIVTASGAAVGLAAYVFQSYKQRIIEKKRSEQLDELLKKKREIADVRLENIQLLRNGFKETIVPRMAKLYDKEFHEEVAIDDPIRQQKIDSFRRDFVLAVKIRYLEAILDYVVAEMQAWQKTKQESGMPRPDINRIIDEELMTWPTKLEMTRDDGSDWDDMLSEYISQPRKSYPYPIYLMFSDPYMLRTYVGLDIQSASNVSDPLIQLEYKEEEKTVRPMTAEVETPQTSTLRSAEGRLQGKNPQTSVSIPVQHILEQNPYYNDCVRLLNDSHVPAPKGFSWRDGLIMGTYVSVLLLLAVLIWQTDGLLFAVLAILYCITVPFTVLPVTENLPYVKEEIKYEEMLKSIKRREENIAKKYNSIVINE